MQRLSRARIKTDLILWYVYIEAGRDVAATEAPTHERDVLISEMVEELHDELHYLREQLNQELER